MSQLGTNSPDPNTYALQTEPFGHSTYRERCDDKPRGGSKVLIAVHIHGVGHSHDTVV